MVTFRNHGWRSRGIDDAVFAHFFEILKSGGKLRIAHMADPEQDWLSKNIGYVGRDYVIAKAIKAASWNPRAFSTATHWITNATPAVSGSCRPTCAAWKPRKRKRHHGQSVNPSV